MLKTPFKGYFKCPFSSELVRDRERVFILLLDRISTLVSWLSIRKLWLYVFSLAFLSACTLSLGQEKQNSPVPLTLNATTNTETEEIETHTPTGTFQPTWTIKPSIINTQIPTISPTWTRTSLPTETLEPLGVFTTTLLREGISPQIYLEDPCTFLERRWAAESSLPGTVVLPIMFHSIYKDGRVVNDPKEISVTEFENLISSAVSMGFETITAEELYNFLDHNARIPEHSMIMIVDDRRPGLIQERFMPVLEKYDWTVTSAYITDPDSLQWAWELMDQLYASGRVDIQSHGYSGQLYIVEQTPEDEIRNEIERSTLVLEERYGKRPIAFIWPGGNFTSLAVDIARQDGYLLGFTAYSRGPLMFNWIPLGEEERSVNDPLMVLPRAWSNSAVFNLEQAIEIGNMAKEYARNNFDLEARWYETLCGGELPIPQN